MKSCAAGSRPLSVKLRRPHSRYFFERSTLVVLAPPFAAHTENPHVYAKTFSTVGQADTCPDPIGSLSPSSLNSGNPAATCPARNLLRLSRWSRNNPTE